MITLMLRDIIAPPPLIVILSSPFGSFLYELMLTTAYTGPDTCGSAACFRGVTFLQVCFCAGGESWKHEYQTLGSNHPLSVLLMLRRGY